MKYILMTLLFVSSSFVFAETVKVEVNGMVCSMCAQGIEKKFKKIDAVEGIKVDLDNKVVEIQIKEKKALSDEVITKHIQDAGYNVGSIKRQE